MIDQIKQYIEEVKRFTSKDSKEIEDFRIKFLGKKGILNDLFAYFKTVPNEQKKEFGQTVNQLKNLVTEKVQILKSSLEDSGSNELKLDLTRPGEIQELGARHPINSVKNRIIDIFSRIGFTLSDGPEIEDDWHNFTALNLPEHHPARDMQDTFFIKSDKEELVLRTHTSPVQIRVMENMKAPIKTIMPGRVYRNEALDSTHLAEFHQIEGLYIDENVSMSELKAMMMTFAKKLYGDNLEFRFRPSFFPFTEPSAEMDIRRHGSNKWMEVVGCGMVHPNVLKAGGIDSEKYSGFAFGFGIERITMIRTSLDDIRALYENDVRVLRQF